MIAEKNLEEFGNLLQSEFLNYFDSFRDISFLNTNVNLLPNIITKKQKDFIIKNNKEFYDKLKIVYLQNEELKHQLIELKTEQQKLKNTIINLDKKFKKNIISKEKIYIINSYRKRNRRKKVELNKNYECYFPNCNKRYLTKSSLNLHIKLKHQK